MEVSFSIDMGNQVIKNGQHTRSNHANFCLMYLTLCFTGCNVTVNSLHPGTVVTELVRFKDEYILPLRLFITAIFYLLFVPFIKTSKAGAQTSVYLAVDPDVAHVTGKYFR